MSAWEILISLLGYGILGLIAHRILTVVYNILYPFLIGTPIDLKKRVGAGKWAVVTGATDGIGKAYAIQLAKEGFDVLLISRTQSRLDTTKKEILTHTNGIEIDTFAFDFTSSTVEEYQPLIKKLKDYEVGILVNNVGMFIDYPHILHEQEGGLEKLTDITVLNMLPVVLLSSTVLEQMSARNSGIIINISSISALIPMTKLNVYSAAKRFVSHLSDILRVEYHNKDIIIQTITPGVVATKMSMVEQSTFFSPDPERFVKSALRTVGLVDETTGCIGHQIQALIFQLMPQFMMNKAIDESAEQMRDLFRKSQQKTKNNQ